ncbi:MAG TPA: serine/threonine-protein kinase [Gemmatimonadales bacterium]|nr:serine/threonine-protein kinase [Gemmatimonadales bacterium]
MTDPLERLRDALVDRYRVERVLGTGGMATVYLAKDLRHQRHVALKVLHPELSASLGAERFLREVTIAAGLTHPHILPVHDSGSVDELLFYVMPYVEGPSLRQRLAEEGELPVADAVRILREIADAVALAHRRGIVHRDLKPENVMLSGEHAIVADFGVAKALHVAGGHERLTATGMAVGTPAYMAPEQAAGDAMTDHRADIYALGVLGYELLTGAPPFVGSSPQQVVVAHLTRAPEPIGSLRPGVPTRIAAAVMRCLEKRPADRWQSADEFRRQLNADASSGEAAIGQAPATVAGFLPITEDICRRLDRSTFDPRMLGDRLAYLDNQVRSDVLVLLIHNWAVEAIGPEAVLPRSPYRVVVPTLYGFERERVPRFPVGIADHIVLLEAMLDQLAARDGVKLVIAVGFSAAGDLVLRMAGEESRAARLDGCLALGPNVGVETCTVTGVLSEVTSSAPEVLLPLLNRALASATTTRDWLDLADDFRQIVHNFGDDFRPIQRFAHDIVTSWRVGGPDVLIRWYRQASEAGRLVRCVFEDSEVYRTRVRALQLAHLDEGVLGEGYRPGSMVVESVAGHFDLLDPALVMRHLDAMVGDLRGSARRGA